MNLNLHAVVRGAITSVREDIAGTVYVSTGRQNINGILVPQFTAVGAQLQVQAQSHGATTHDGGALHQSSYYTIYAYGEFSDLDRPDGRGGDICAFNNQFWAITKVIEWWPLWCSFEVTRQLNAATLSALLAQLANGNPAD